MLLMAAWQQSAGVDRSPGLQTHGSLKRVTRISLCSGYCSLQSSLNVLHVRLLNSCDNDRFHNRGHMNVQDVCFLPFGHLCVSLSLSFFFLLPRLGLQVL